jgi:hypothetical protein
MKLIRLAIGIVLFGVIACGGNDVTAPSCNNGPYTFDSNPNVQRCRASNGQFAQNMCCGR